MNNFNNFGLPINNNPFVNQTNDVNGMGMGNNSYFAPTKPMDYDGYFGSQTKKPSFWDKTKMFFSQYGSKIFGWGITIFGGLGAFALGKKFIDLDVPYGKNEQKPSEDASLMVKAKYHLCTFLSDTVGIMKPYEAEKNDEDSTETSTETSTVPTHAHAPASGAAGASKHVTPTTETHAPIIHHEDEDEDEDEDDYDYDYDDVEYDDSDDDEEVNTTTGVTNGAGYIAGNSQNNNNVLADIEEIKEQYKTEKSYVNRETAALNAINGLIKIRNLSGYHVNVETAISNILTDYSSNVFEVDKENQKIMITPRFRRSPAQYVKFSEMVSDATKFQKFLDKRKKDIYDLLNIYNIAEHDTVNIKFNNEYSLNFKISNTQKESNSQDKTFTCTAIIQGPDRNKQEQEFTLKYNSVAPYNKKCTFNLLPNENNDTIDVTSINANEDSNGDLPAEQEVMLPGAAGAPAPGAVTPTPTPAPAPAPAPEPLIPTTPTGGVIETAGETKPETENDDNLPPAPAPEPVTPTPTPAVEPAPPAPVQSFSDYFADTTKSKHGAFNCKVSEITNSKEFVKNLTGDAKTALVNELKKEGFTSITANRTITKGLFGKQCVKNITIAKKDNSANTFNVTLNGDNFDIKLESDRIVPVEVEAPAETPAPAESVVKAIEQKLELLTEIKNKSTTLTISKLVKNLLSKEEFKKLNDDKKSKYFTLLSNIFQNASGDNATSVKTMCEASIIAFKNIEDITKEDIEKVDEKNLSSLKNNSAFKTSNMKETYNNYIDKLKSIANDGANDEIKNTAKIHLIIAKDEITDKDLNGIENIDITKLNLSLNTKKEYVDKLTEIVEANTGKKKNVTAQAAEVKAKVLNSVTSFDKSYLFFHHFRLSENELSLISHETQKQYVNKLSQIFNNSNTDRELQKYVAKAKHTALQNIKNCKDIQDFLLTDDEYNMLIDKSSYYKTLNLIYKNKSNESVRAAIATAKMDCLSKSSSVTSAVINGLQLTNDEYNLLDSNKQKTYSDKLHNIIYSTVLSNSVKKAARNALNILTTSPSASKPVTLTSTEEVTITGFFTNAKRLKIGTVHSCKFSTMLEDSSGNKLSAFLNYNYTNVKTIIDKLASQNPIELSRDTNKKLIFKYNTIDNTYTITIKQDHKEKTYTLALNDVSKKINLTPASAPGAPVTSAPEPPTHAPALEAAAVEPAPPAVEPAPPAPVAEPPAPSIPAPPAPAPAPAPEPAPEPVTPTETAEETIPAEETKPETENDDNLPSAPASEPAAPEPVPEPVPVPALEDENLSAVRERKAEEEEEEEEEDVADAWINIMTTGIITNDSDLSTNQEPTPAPAPAPAPEAPAAPVTSAPVSTPTYKKVDEFTKLNENTYFQIETSKLKLKCVNGKPNTSSITLEKETIEIMLIQDQNEQKNIDKKFKHKNKNRINNLPKENAFVAYGSDKKYTIVTKNKNGIVQYYSQV